MVDFVKSFNVCARKAKNKAAKRIINSDNVCHSYSHLNFGVTFLEDRVVQGWAKCPSTILHYNLGHCPRRSARRAGRLHVR